MEEPTTRAQGDAQGPHALGTLDRVDESIRSRAALGELLEDTLQRSAELLRAEAGAIYLADEPAHELVLASHRGLSIKFAAEEARLPIGTCMCGHTVTSGGSLFLVEDTLQEPRCVTGHCIQDGFRSLLCLPLAAGGRVWGLLRLHGRNPGAFDRREAKLLSFIGSQLGLAIQRARLQEEVAQLLERIEEERATLDSLVRSLIDGLILVDGKGHIAYWNPSAERYLGLKAEAMLGQGWEAVDAHLRAVARNPETSLDGLRQALADMSSRPEFGFQVTAPAPRILQARFFPVHDRQGFGIVLRDVTGERRLDEMKEDLLSTVSHELRTPLASIKGFATTLLREDVQWDTATQREFLEIIDQESDRLGELIANLLDSSRIGAGTLRIDYGPVHLPQLAAEAVLQMGRRAPGRIFSTKIPADLPVITADARRVRQVLHNLLENAIKYSTGGEIHVSARTDGREVRVSVSDQGIGIAPDHLERIFQRFYQVDGAAMRRSGGAGLGLSICRGIIEAHGGRIWAESTPRVGSTFHFTLPIERRMT